MADGVDTVEVVDRPMNDTVRETPEMRIKRKLQEWEQYVRSQENKKQGKKY
jgi:hypothetical protein